MKSEGKKLCIFLFLTLKCTSCSRVHHFLKYAVWRNGIDNFLHKKLGWMQTLSDFLINLIYLNQLYLIIHTAVLCSEHNPRDYLKFLSLNVMFYHYVICSKPEKNFLLLTGQYFKNAAVFSLFFTSSDIIVIELKVELTFI